MKLRDRSVVITGAAQGIGRASAELFAREGATVALADINAEGVREVARRIEEFGGRALAIEADVSVEADVRRMIDAAVSAFGRLDVLFNNAGIVVQGTVEETAHAEWERQIATTLTSAYLGCRFAIPVMLRQGGGLLLNMASVAGVMGLPNRAAYCAAKAGVIGLTRAIAVDYAGTGIRAVYLAPGTIETPSLSGRIESAADPGAERAKYAARQPLGRLGSADEIAAAALYLASDEASFITGSGLVIDGGMSV
ncbi:MAG: SDR family oxidoreductase [Armatimonadetes bacterium]|nr:SDR family oxidoreductase [Armatimonadota bacterium]MDE2206280.1 SDR family oxidoreductase [Armatimonadota bacterium]